MEAEILFSEKQKFNQWWIWLILLLSCAAIFYFTFNRAFIESETFNITGIFLASLPPLLLIILFALFRLDSQIRKDGVYVRFFPIHSKFRQYKWDQISKSYVRQYSPIGEFGGWGIRGLGNDKALNISGNKGLQLQFADGRRLLIGTNKPGEITTTLNSIGQNKS